MEGDLSGTVLLVFQPAEEGLAGAKHIVESGTFDGVTAVHGLHVWPGLHSGIFASRVRVILLCLSNLVGCKITWVSARTDHAYPYQALCNSHQHYVARSKLSRAFSYPLWQVTMAKCRQYACLAP